MRTGAGREDAAALRSHWRLGERTRAIGAVYFTAVEIDANTVLRFEPKRFTTAMMVRAMPEAMRPYSMAVAPDSSFRNALNFRRISQAPRPTGARLAPAGGSGAVYCVESQITVIYHSGLCPLLFAFLPSYQRVMLTRTAERPIDAAGPEV